MCSLSRYVVIGGFSGVAAATMTGSDLVGWIVAAVAVGMTALAMRRWPGLSGACTVPAPPAATDAPHADDVPRDDAEVRSRA